MKVNKEQEPIKIKYKKGFHYSDDLVSIYIIKPSRGLYRVEGSYKYPPYKMFSSSNYSSLEGCANYLLKNFNIELVY